MPSSLCSWIPICYAHFYTHSEDIYLLLFLQYISTINSIFCNRLFLPNWQLFPSHFPLCFHFAKHLPFDFHPLIFTNNFDESLVLQRWSFTAHYSAATCHWTCLRDMFTSKLTRKSHKKSLEKFEANSNTRTTGPPDHRTTNKVVQLYRLNRSKSLLVCISSETETMRAHLNNNNKE